MTVKLFIDVARIYVGHCWGLDNERMRHTPRKLLIGCVVLGTTHGR